MVTRVARVVVSLAALVCATGCSATTGSGWVREPEPGFFANDDVTLQPSAHTDGALVEPLAPSPTIELDGEPTTRPRLAQTVTLGDSYTDRTPEQRAADRSSVNVTVNNYMTPRNDSYDGYYGGYAVPLIRHSRGNRPSQPIARPPTRSGQGHGPPFPYKTAPGNPWLPAH